MTISPLTIYLWQLLDSLRGLAQGIAIPCSIGAVVSTIILVLSLMENEKSAVEISKKCLQWFASCAGVLWLLFVLVPTSNTITMMFVIPKLAESKVIQTDLPDLYDIAIKALKEQLAPKK